MNKTILQLTDLHMEKNSNINFLNVLFKEKIADILVLTGDINNGTSALPFIKKLLEFDYTVIYILGNNEFYNFSINSVINDWRKISSELNNFYFLESESIVIDNIEFIGSCLWTSVGTSNENEEISKEEIEKIKDTMKFKVTEGLNSHSMKDLFYNSVKNIDQLLSESKAEYKIVLSHYLPSYKSIAEKYRGSRLTNLFASDAEWLMEKHDINYWFHGHTHAKVKYSIKNTHIICNPYGRKEDNNKNFNLKDSIIEIKKPA